MIMNWKNHKKPLTNFVEICLVMIAVSPYSSLAQVDASGGIQFGDGTNSAIEENAGDLQIEVPNGNLEIFSDKIVTRTSIEIGSYTYRSVDITVPPRVHPATADNAFITCLGKINLLQCALDIDLVVDGHFGSWSAKYEMLAKHAALPEIMKAQEYMNRTSHIPGYPTENQLEFYAVKLPNSNSYANLFVRYNNPRHANTLKFSIKHPTSVHYDFSETYRDTVTLSMVDGVEPLARHFEVEAGHGIPERVLVGTRFDVVGDATFSGDVTIDGVLNVTRNVTVSGDLNVSGAIRIEPKGGISMGNYLGQ